MSDRNRNPNPDESNRYAAALLRGLVERVDNLEQSITEEGVPNVIRKAEDSVSVGDAATVASTTTTTTFSWDDGTAGTWDDGAGGKWG